MVKAKGLTFKDVARLATAFPGVTEGTSYGTQALKADGKFLARLKEDGESLVLRMDIVSRDFLLRAEPRLFYITDHYRDYPAVLVHLPQVTTARMRELLEDAWRLVATRKRIVAYDAALNAK
jgi:hypothetical protein